MEPEDGKWTSEEVPDGKWYVAKVLGEVGKAEEVQREFETLVYEALSNVLIKVLSVVRPNPDSTRQLNLVGRVFEQEHVYSYDPLPPELYRTVLYSGQGTCSCGMKFMSLVDFRRHVYQSVLLALAKGTV